LYFLKFVKLQILILLSILKKSYLFKENILLNLQFLFSNNNPKNKLMMKKTLLILVIFTAINTAFAQRVVNSNQKQQTTQSDTQKSEDVNATIDFESKVVDYGVIENKSDGARKFVFTNNGTDPLVIKTAKGSCGCTVPTWPKDPIAPGESGEIGVKYDTKRTGKFTKTITLTTNADRKPVILTIKGSVNPPPKDTQTLQKKNSGAPLEKK